MTFREQLGYDAVMRNIPSVIQLPGGVKLTGIVFKVVEYNQDGSPKLFEFVPDGVPGQGTPHQWVFFGDPIEVRAPGAKERADERR